MKQLNLFLLILIVVIPANGQHGYQLKKMMSKIYNEKLYQQSQLIPAKQGFSFVTAPLRGLNHEIKLPSVPSQHQKSFVQNDTLFVGYTPGDSLIITGSFTHNGVVVVAGDGILRFKNADATIYGDLLIFGTRALVTIDSSTVRFPQSYFYNRAVVMALGAKIIARNSTLDYSGLSHSLLLIDSASVFWENVTNLGFTTCGLNHRAQININGTNTAGEYIMRHNTRATIKNANTVLIWHCIPDSSSLDFSFPEPDTVNHYIFHDSLPGITNLDYIVELDSSTNVMWGLMPSAGSTVNIHNSQLRVIGLWFERPDTLTVSGLINNTYYPDFDGGMTDRIFRLQNTYVTTWSLYTFNDAFININGCTMGEIGSQNRSTTMSSNTFVDGSGGYWWSTDSAFNVAINSIASTVRSERYSTFLYAYSLLFAGTLSAVHQSVLLVAQCSVVSNPVAYDHAAAWFVNISSPDTCFNQSLVTVKGSAFIDKAAGSPLADFSKYRLYWQKTGDIAWTLINEQYTEKRNDTLGIWNTSGLQSGDYLLKAVIYDNSPDSNALEAIRQVFVDPLTQQPVNSAASSLVIYPSPASDYLYLSTFEIFNSVNLYSPTGILLKTWKNHHGPFPIDWLNPGIYFLQFNSNNNNTLLRFIKQ